MTVLDEDEKVLSLEGSSDGSHKSQKKKTSWWLLPLQIFGTTAFLILIGYYVVFTNVETFVSSVSNKYHWMLGWGSGIISFIIAAAAARPIYFSLSRALIWKLSQRDLMILGTCVVLVAGSSYLNRNRFFAKGAQEKEICAALLPGDMPTVKGLGLGAEEGLTCLSLSRKEASLALAIDRSKIPKELQPRSLFELDALEPFSNTGAIAIYIGEGKGSDPKIYDGPGFNPRKLGILLPVTEDQLIAYKATQRVKILGEMNALRLQKEQEAKAAVELAERQRAAAEAETKRLQQERLAAEAAEERRIQAENQRQAEEKKKSDKASKDRSDWWTTLFVLVGIAVVGTMAAGPIGLGIGVLLILIHLARS